MKLIEIFGNLFTTNRKIMRKTIAEYKHEMLVENAREQFQYLLKKKIRIPVVLL